MEVSREGDEEMNRKSVAKISFLTGLVIALVAPPATAVETQ